ncbi:FimV/HubP family polar landmark protein [Pseudoduganella rivuli]|uniref:FimV/HubP family polar landmark protein n=1 Tax=Pseudoduganella rivuli TaxID=2666085 RepID=UPI00280BAC22|nr:FimV/HubP family polar landmark protein [Pseudoduganella rivuli]
MLSPVANAAGLGKLTVLSSLGQPLRAEIELTAVAAEESSDLTAKLAPTEAFRLANIDFNPALLSLRFEVENRNGRQLIRVSSSQPINEPFVDMLLELSWTGGRLVREYTFLLDPAEMRSAQAPQVAAPVDVPGRAAAAAPAAAAAQAARAAAPARPVREPSREPAAPREGTNASEYRVKPGDTLGRIARQLKPVDVSLDMMLVALYRANPEAFAGNNMNRLKSGQILNVPDSDAIKGGASEGEAHGVVIAHAADFNAYRNKLAGQVASSTPAQGGESGQSAAGKITAKVEERATPANEAKDQLKLSKATGGEGGAGKTAKTSEEDRIAREKQVAEANARVKELEKNVTDLEKLMAVKSKAMADKQKAASAPASAPVASAPVVAPVPVEAPPAPKKPAKPVITEPSLMDTVMDNIQLIGAGLVALLGVAGLAAMRRRRAAQEAPKTEAPKAEVSVLGDPGPQAQPLIAETGGQSVDTNNSVFNSNFAPSASQLDTNEVDPVAEADVYIAYGRDAQAEEILKEALRTHPERHPVRLKLMEIFSNRKDARSYEAQATELYSLTKGQGDEWAQAAAMGLALDPNNPLYAGSGAAVAASMAATDAPLAAATDAPLSADDFANMFAEPAPVPSVAPAAEAHDFSGLDLDLSSDATASAPTEPPVHAMDFSLDDLTALPSLDDTPPATQAPIPAADAEHFLDFDLGGLSMDTTQAPSVAPVEAASAEPFDLAFDMEPPPAAATEAPSAEPAVAPLTADDFAMDFGLDLPTTAPAVDLPTEAPAAAADPLAELDMMDFNLPGTTAAETAAPESSDVAVAEAAEPALAADDFAIPDFPELDVAATQAPSAPPTAADFDLSGIDLDLIGSNAKLATPAEGGEEMSALQMEMDTKLDLAIAYQEIGDKEGARELLDEVIRGGTGDQVNRANAMRAALG